MANNLEISVKSTSKSPLLHSNPNHRSNISRGEHVRWCRNFRKLHVLIFAFTLFTLTKFCNGDETKLNYADATLSATMPESKFDENSLESSNQLTNKDGSEKSTIPTNDLGFIHAFVASISVILVSELGDKTFFIAAIMAMRHSRVNVFVGAISALAFMTILSVVFGMAATIIPRVYTYWISTALFAIFGLKMLKEGYYMSPNEGQEELEEVQSDLKKREDELIKSMKDEGTASNDVRGSTVSLRLHRDDDDDDDSDDQTKSMMRMSGSSNHINEHNSTVLPSSSSATPASTSKNDVNATDMMELKQLGTKKRAEKETSLVTDVESGVVRKNKQRYSAAYAFSRTFMQAFTMTFLAEWGDRSQVTTIILSAREDVTGVIFGGILGHSICTGLAVIGGRIIAQKISVRTVTIIGGVVFLLFAISALFFNPE